MTFPGVLTQAQLNALRDGGYYADCYLLVWDAPIIFQAQINQATFSSSFATLTYDNVTIGAYTDIRSDYLCYVGSVEGDLLNAEHRFRIRADNSYDVATSSVININETSADLSDNWYIMVVKDIPPNAKIPRTITGTEPANYTYPRDYEITFRRLLPILYNVSPYYAGVLQDGIFDLPLAPLALLTDNDATGVSTWAWDIDGLAFESGGASTQNVTVRATEPGKYLLRVTATDNLGQQGYFTIKLWIVPQDRSEIIHLSFDAPQITGDVINGWTCSIRANFIDRTSPLTRIDQWPNRLDCAIWLDGNMPTITNGLVFAGRFERESLDTTYDSNGVQLLSASFKIEGLTARMLRLISRRIQMTQSAAPSVFGEIETLTVWRAISYFLTEHTVIPNIAPIVFSDTSDKFQWPRFSSGDSSALESINDVLFTINASFMTSPTGVIEIARKAWMISDSDRNALPVIGNFTTQDMMVDASGGLLFNTSSEYTPVIGRELGGGGYYITATGGEQVLRALTPSVAQSEGQERATVDRQILARNSALSAAKTELGQRTADDRAARQPQTILRTRMPASYIQAVIPHDAKWYTWTINADETPDGSSYTTSDRWTCQSVSIGYDQENGIPTLDAVFKLETQGVGFQTVVTTPPIGQVRLFNPVVPVAPVYAAFPELPEAVAPDPSNIEIGDIPPYTPDDVDKATKPEDPHSSGGGVGGVGGFGERAGVRAKAVVIWDASTVWDVNDVRLLQRSMILRRLALRER